MAHYLAIQISEILIEAMTWVHFPKWEANHHILSEPICTKLQNSTSQDTEEILVVFHSLAIG